jgi:hypothetical protein
MSVSKVAGACLRFSRAVCGFIILSALTAKASSPDGDARTALAAVTGPAVRKAKAGAIGYRKSLSTDSYAPACIALNERA